MSDEFKPGCFGSIVMFTPARSRCQVCPYNSRCHDAVEEAKIALAPLLDKDALLSKPPRRTKKIATTGVAASSAPPPSKTIVVSTPFSEKNDLLAAFNNGDECERPMLGADPERAAPPGKHVAPASPPSAPTLNKKPREYVELWTKRNVPFEDMKRGLNPFTTQQGFIRVFVEGLLNAHGKQVNRVLMLAWMKDRLRKDDGSQWSDASLISHYNIAVDSLAHLGLLEKTAIGVQQILEVT